MKGIQKYVNSLTLTSQLELLSSIIEPSENNKNVLQVC